MSASGDASRRPHAKFVMATAVLAIWASAAAIGQGFVGFGPAHRDKGFGYGDWAVERRSRDARRGAGRPEYDRTNEKSFNATTEKTGREAGRCVEERTEKLIHAQIVKLIHAERRLRASGPRTTLAAINCC